MISQISILAALAVAAFAALQEVRAPVGYAGHIGAGLGYVGSGLGYARRYGGFGYGALGILGGLGYERYGY
ncbi:hypothetical protein TNIN_389831 [Trichonephila inaurata madagascariensis]|uniref:Uncharacterized protein n=1 Tax=Trichonephila inaurata madagascariensis TaxID=2747483 RepID=A0A8X7BZ43_9ARAC|nr:hypothetical protein TNIN_389831 [Trichonephila inaurata madagascariensis]